MNKNIPNLVLSNVFSNFTCIFGIMNGSQFWGKIFI